MDCVLYSATILLDFKKQDFKRKEWYEMNQG